MQQKDKPSTANRLQLPASLESQSALSQAAENAAERSAKYSNSFVASSFTGISISPQPGGMKCSWKISQVLHIVCSLQLHWNLSKPSAGWVKMQLKEQSVQQIICSFQLQSALSQVSKIQLKDQPSAASLQLNWNLN
jgi:hypothetical protein